ncbi:DUF4123 domain-containing protein [Variovorax beijingensis]|uniref:DUF4123 domain-containing protein n=1 Tax=Variovorax beijingensis TaxID=2496117 RepID=A0A3P3F1W5_9BURK|nr:DUF4123 domain-containing protein [Variovorax beijingensis]RRH92487.1 DUF4123 domain-containing protein [Variovorax beijingensis]RSZ42922.1 DUF4123 domain-containing protein [Variovorax beijingensis]
MNGVLPVRPDASLLLRSLQKGFSRARTQAPLAHASVARPLSAFMVLERWRDNPLAEHLQEHHPLLADERVDVPDEIYRGRPEAAPTLVPLPADWAVDAPGASTQAVLHTMALALAAARLQSERRLVEQMLCAIVFSPATPASIAMHWARLGFQTSPADGKDKLFRYQDTRVMQRVWPLLDDEQRLQWLGPVTEWWALSQPWRPWPYAEAFATGGEVPAGSGEDAPEWFIATRPVLSQAAAPEPRHETMRHLLRLDQWHAAHGATTGTRLWLSMASRRIPVQRQPDGETMTRLLRQGVELGLSQESDLSEFVDASWRAHHYDDRLIVRDWSAPRDAAVLRQTLALMYPTRDHTNQPANSRVASPGFASALHEAEQAFSISTNPNTPRRD